VKRQIAYTSSRIAIGVLLSVGICLALPPNYKGKPFRDEFHQSGPQPIPGRVECALYDLGGEGVAYHDVDASNNGAKLNHESGQCRPGTSPYICYFRENEGVDISYVKSWVDLSHPNLFSPEQNQLYIGWALDNEWLNYTVDVKVAGVYKIVALYGNLANTIEFSLNNKPASICKLPVATGSMHKWNKAEVGEITFPKKGKQLLTLHYNQGDNLAYFEFELVKKR
jgi:hypothetical protein